MNHILWAGTDHSFRAYEQSLSAYEKAAPQLAKMQAMGMEIEVPDLYSKVGDVGVLNIHGFLDEGSAGFMRLFGMVGYQDLEDAALQMVQDKSIKKILLNVRSPGGNARGLESLSGLLQNIATVKPMTTYADEMCSAGYWLGSIGRHLTVGRMAEVGSLGVVVVASNRAKQLEKDGVEAKVIRSGRYKALGNPYETFSEDFIADTQEKVDYLSQMFTNHVSEMRGQTTAIVDTVMGQGKVFLGSQGVSVGLADSVGDINDAIKYAKTHADLLTMDAV